MIRLKFKVGTCTLSKLETKKMARAHCPHNATWKEKNESASAARITKPHCLNSKRQIPLQTQIITSLKSTNKRPRLNCKPRF